MGRSRIIFHPEAVREVESARNWYREKSSAAEKGFIAELNHAVEQVASAPLRWPSYKAKTRRFVFKRYPYSVVYRVYDGDLVRVLAIVHGKRRADYWISRMEG